MIEQSEIKFKPAYTENGTKVTHRRKDYWKQTGVYIIRVEGVIRYVGRSAGCVYRACYRHFQKWCKKPRNSGHMDSHYPKNGAEVAIIITDDFEIGEAQLAHELQPTDNRYWFGMLPPKKDKQVWGRNPRKEIHSEDYDYIRQCEIDNGIFDENY